MGLLQQMYYGGRTTPTYPYEWYYADTNFYLSAYEKAQNSETVLAADRYTIITPNLMQIDVDGTGLTQYSSQSIDLSVATNWDDYYNDSDWDSTNYTTAANRKGLDFYVYVVVPSVGSVPKFLVSTSTTYPIGYTAATSRMIGGFHCFCSSMSVPVAWVAATNYVLGSTVIPTVANNHWYRCVADAGSSAAVTQPTWPTTNGTTIVDSGITWVCEPVHSLSGYVTGDVLPMSVWDLKRKSAATYGNIGQVYNPDTEEWCGIYLTSGSLNSPTIVYNGTIYNSVTWNNAVDAGSRLGMKLPTDYGFQSLAEGSNQMTAGNSSNAIPSPATTIEYSDTATRRLVSNIGCESCCGVVDQWLDEQGWKFSSPASHTHIIASISGDIADSYISGVANQSIAPAYTYAMSTDSRGRVYMAGATGDVKMIAGGNYLTAHAAYCGSRSRKLDAYRWYAHATIGFRLVADSKEK